jgi:hypothetical protein
MERGSGRGYFAFFAAVAALLVMGLVRLADAHRAAFEAGPVGRALGLAFLLGLMVGILLEMARGA